MRWNWSREGCGDSGGRRRGDVEAEEGLRLCGVWLRRANVGTAESDFDLAPHAMRCSLARLSSMFELAEEDGEFVGGVAQVREEARLHLEDGDAGGVAAEVDGGDGASAGGEDGDGEGAEADLVLLIAEGVAVAADVAQERGGASRPR